MSANDWNPLLLWLQIAGGSFPTGCFNHSYGLETYIQEGRARHAGDIEKLMIAFMEASLGTDAVFVKEAHGAAEVGDTERLQFLHDLYSAVKTARETHEASLKTGRSLLRGVQTLLDDAEAIRAGRFLPLKPPPVLHYPVAYGTIAAMLRLPPDETVETYLFSGAASLVSVASRIMPLGQTEAQKLLFRLNRVLTSWRIDVSGLCLEKLQTFSPGLEVASMRHETLYTRLCMS